VPITTGIDVPPPPDNPKEILANAPIEDIATGTPPAIKYCGQDHEAAITIVYVESNKRNIMFQNVRYATEEFLGHGLYHIYGGFYNPTTDHSTFDQVQEGDVSFVKFHHLSPFPPETDLNTICTFPHP